VSSAYQKDYNWRNGEGLHSFPASMQNHRSLRSTNMKISRYPEQGVSQDEVLARIYFSMTG
jgi:hypothetical protein